MPHRTIRARRFALASAGVLSLALVATACGGSGGGTSAAPKDFKYLSVTENTTTRTALTTLSKSACKTENDALPLKVETIPQAQLDQKLQLLAGQDALPSMFAAGNAPALTKQLAKGGKVADIEMELERLGVLDQLEPAAVSTIKALYGGKLMALPYEYNIEGIFYNKKLFQENGIAVPGTWDELLAAAEKLNAKGIQPFSASGAQGWPLTRLISGYLYRSLGPDALDKVDAGTAQLTDPEYVKAAEEIAALGKEGYFGKGVGSIDYDTAMNQFLTGKSGMFYMGSWALANIADPKQNKIGAENVGFMPFPAVKGGKGSVDQYPSNIGLAVTLGSKTFDDKTGAWVSCIAKNFGSTALKDHGTITGFKVNTPVKDSSEVAGTVRKTISSSKQNVLWFEALFSTKATTLSNTSAPGLVNGSISPQKFMETVQAALGSQ